MSNSYLVVRLQTVFERMFVQQMVIRRLIAECPSAFYALDAIRDDLLELMVVEHQQLGQDLAVRVASSWLTLLERQAGRRAILERDVAFLAEDLADVFDMTASWTEVCDLLAEHASTVAEFQRDFNFLDYCSLLSLTSYCSGSSMCANREKILAEITDHDKERFPNELVWIDPTKKTTADLRTAILLSQQRSRFTSPGIQVIDSRASRKTHGTNDAVSLVVNLNQAPADIDRALAYFKAAIEERLCEVHELEIPGWQDYLGTNFAKWTSRDADVVPQKSMVVPRILGLWCWDLTSGLNLTPVEQHKLVQGLSIAKAYEKIDELRRSKSQDTPGFAKVSKARKEISALIDAGGDTPTRLDLAVTGHEGIRLGKRSAVERVK
ncbi:MAG: hypothetical protein LCH79_15970 [Proteobacteria bacterium]|nr:hypothetical protein [Pseudomonadota bacterium]